MAQMGLSRKGNFIASVQGSSRMQWDQVPAVFSMTESEATDTNFGHVESLNVVETAVKSSHIQYPKKTGIRSLKVKYMSL